MSNPETEQKEPVSITSGRLHLKQETYIDGVRLEDYILEVVKRKLHKFDFIAGLEKEVADMKKARNDLMDLFTVAIKESVATTVSLLLEALSNQEEEREVKTRKLRVQR